MRNIPFVLFALLTFGSLPLQAQVFTDVAANYGGSWSNGSNQGTGFGAWQLSAGNNTGRFIGNPANDGMQTTGIGTTAFGMFATSSVNYSTAYRPFAQGLEIGDAFSFYWVINWDANTGSKGFDLRSGSTTVFNINNQGNAQITGSNGLASSAFGILPMLVTVVRMSTTQYFFSMSRRLAGGGEYTTVFSSSNPVNGINFYIGAQGSSNGERNLYFNQLRIEKGLYPNPVPNFVQYKWSGSLTPTSAKVNAKLSLTATNTRLVVSTSPTFSNPIYSQPINVTSATNFVGSYSIGGLTPGTEYFYGIESNGLLDPRPGATGRFKTPLEGPHSFSFTAGACNLNSRNPVWQRIREKDPLFMLVSGDLHYSDPNSTNVNVHRIPYEDRVLSIENTRTLFNNVPIAYVWDDHDFSGDDSNASSTGANSAKQAYREYVPHYPFGTGITSGNSAIYQSFVIGRVRFLLTDLRSEKTDDAVMSAQQVQWFRQQCLEAKAQQQLICWVSSFGITANNTDAWGGTSANLAQRNELFSFLAANNIDNLFVLSGDAHAAGIDDGANTDCSGVLDTHTCPRFTCSLNPRYPLLQAAGLSNTVSIKGIVTNILPMTGQDHHGQYAKVDVTDNGSDSVTVRFTVYRVHPDTGVESVLGTYSFSRHLGAASNRSTPVTTGDSWKYLDNGSDQGTTWRAGSFNDAGWAEGPAPLGYAMTGLRTTVSFGSDANNKHITTYFRKAFTVANVCRVKAAYLELSVDDGAVLYLNNREVGRANFAAGAYNHLTPASDVVTNRGQTFRFCITDTSFFRTGTNLLAVEVHQHAGNSSDLFFNLHVTLEESDEPVTSTTTVTACNAFTWNGQTYTESGTYSFATLTAAGCDSLARLQLTINRVPITAQPAPVTAVVDESASFTVSTSAGGATFRWQRDAGSGFQDLDNSPPFSGANTATLTVAPLTLAFNNDLYRCVVTASSCSTESGSALLRVNLPTRVVERPTGLPLRLYPNPVLDQLVLEGDPRLAGQPYQIRDALGRQVRSGLLTAATTTLQLEQLPAGIYTLHIGRQGEQRMRFVKQGNK